jgi:hypothetical protein
VLAVTAVLLVRISAWGDDRTAWQAIGEAALFVAVYGASVMRSERALVGELRAALR